jgi:diaminopimelate decarboxylase
MHDLLAESARGVESIARVLPETPAYIYDLAVLRQNLAALRSGLPENCGIYYSLKANPHPLLVRELLAGGARAEVCSPGELDTAVEAGHDAGAILYTGPGKRAADLKYALDAGVRYFSVDSAYGLNQLESVCAAHRSHVRVLLRINDSQPIAGQGLAMTGVASQFGVDSSEVQEQPDRFIGHEHLRLVGLHLYMGSNLATVGDLLVQFRQAVTTAAKLEEALDVRFDVLDLGGGFAAPFAKDGPVAPLAGLREGLTDLLAKYHDREIVFESGRFLVGTAGTLVTAVLDAKVSHGKPVVVLESGINHLGGMAGLRRLPPLNPRPIACTVNGPDRPTIVAGPLCTPLDTWAKAAPLPPLRPGDLLAVPGVGAYGLSASLVAFLGHPTPLEVVVDSDQPNLRSIHVSRLALTRTTS